MQKFHVSSSRWEYQSTRWFVWEMSHQEMNESEKTMVENGKSKSWTLNAFIRDNEMQPCDHMRWWWWYSLYETRMINVQNLNKPIGWNKRMKDWKRWKLYIFLKYILTYKGWIDDEVIYFLYSLNLNDEKLCEKEKTTNLRKVKFHNVCFSLRKWINKISWWC